MLPITITAFKVLLSTCPLLLSETLVNILSCKLTPSLENSYFYYFSLIVVKSLTIKGLQVTNQRVGLLGIESTLNTIKHTLKNEKEYTFSTT